MSRIGIQPLTIPGGVKVEIGKGVATVKGSKGETNVAFPSGIELSQDGDELTVKRQGESRHLRAMHGTVRSLLANAIRGVANGYDRSLEVTGVGYRVALQGRSLVLNLGYSHPIEYPLPDGINVEVNGQTELKVVGFDKQLVGLVAARIRGFAPAEPYKGKGVKYKGEQIRRKVGKAVS